MPEKKKQHYIPQFYLRLFSSDSGQKTINLYNILSKKLIKDATIKNQAYIDYFYGKDLIFEKLLNDIETNASKIVYDIVNDKHLPKHNSDEWYRILAFTLIMHSRTKFASEEIIDMKQKTSDKIRALHNGDDRINKENFIREEAVLLNMEINLGAIDIAYDLVCKLILNETDIPFITSDHPVIFYNQYMEQKNHLDAIQE